MKSVTDQHRNYYGSIANHKNSSHIGLNSYTQKDINGNHVYYHLVDGHTTEMNFIDKDNTQKGVDKGQGDVHHVIRHMIYHIKKHGELKTDSQQSPGGKHLWINFIKSKPKGIKFEVNGQHIDHQNIDEHKDKIWSTRPNKNIVRAYANTTKK